MQALIEVEIDRLAAIFVRALSLNEIGRLFLNPCRKYCCRDSASKFFDGQRKSIELLACYPSYNESDLVTVFMRLLDASDEKFPVMKLHPRPYATSYMHCMENLNDEMIREAIERAWKIKSSAR